MIPPQERQTLEEMMARQKCPSRFRCIESSLEALCHARLHAQLKILECLECTDIPAECKFAEPFAGTFACSCPLRIYIARNFDKWSAESTTVLRQAR